MADTTPGGQRTGEPGAGHRAPKARSSLKTTLAKAFTWTVTVIGLAATVAVFTGPFAKSGTGLITITLASLAGICLIVVVACLLIVFGKDKVTIRVPFFTVGVVVLLAAGGGIGYVVHQLAGPGTGSPRQQSSQRPAPSASRSLTSAAASSKESAPAAPAAPAATPPAAPEPPLSDPGGAGVYGVAFSPDGSRLAVGDMNGSAYLWNPATRTLVAPYRTPSGQQVRSIAMNPSGLLAVGTDNSSFTEGDISVWDTQTHNYLETLSDPGGAGVPGGLAFSPDGLYLVAADANGAIYVWLPYLKAPPVTLHDPATGKVFGLAFRPGTDTFAAADGNGSIYLWDAQTGKQVGTPLQDPDSGGVQGGVSFSADGNLLAAGDANGNVYIWSMETGNIVEALHDPQGLQVNDVSFSPGGTAIAAADNNPAHTASAVRIWILATRKVYTFHDPRTTGALHLAFSPDDSLLAVGDTNGKTYLWDMSWLNG